MTKPARLAMFMALACVPSWALALAFAKTGAAWSSGAGALLATCYGIFPAIAALVVKIGIFRERDAASLGLRVAIDRWLIIGWLAPVGLIALAVLVGTVMPNAHLSLGASDFWDFYRSRVPDAARSAFEKDVQVSLASGTHPALRFFFSGLIGGVMPGALIAFGPELAFRGFVHGELESLGWMRALFTGLAWALWIAPLGLVGFVFPDHRLLGAFFLALGGVGLGLILDGLRARARSIVPGALFTGVFAAIGPLASILVRAQPEWLIGAYGLAGVTALLLAGAVTVWRTFRAPHSLDAQ